MKSIKWMGLFALVIGLTSASPSTQLDEQKIIEVIQRFIKAGDNQDAAELEKCLNQNYRVVMNQLFGSKEVSVLPREVYLQKIKAKEFGGDTRSMKITQLTVNGNSASALVQLNGKKMNVSSLLILVKDASENWQLISDTPVIK